MARFLSRDAFCRLTRFWRHKSKLIELVGVALPRLIERVTRGPWPLAATATRNTSAPIGTSRVERSAARRG